MNRVTVDNLISKFSADVGLDLGTSSTPIIVCGTNIKLREPSYIAIDLKRKKVIAIGHEAKVMYGRSHKGIDVIRPVKNSVIGNFEMATALIETLMRRIKHYGLFRPRVMVGIPGDISEVERRAVQEAVRIAGARVVYLIEQSIASAVGVDLPLLESRGNVILDLGGGTSEVSVISYGGIVISRSLKLAGEKLDEAIQAMVRKKYNLLIGDNTAEEIKIAIGSAIPPGSNLRVVVKGRDLTSGLPRGVAISSEDVYECMQEGIRNILELVRNCLESTPAELTGDIIDSGIVMTGGLSQLNGLDTVLSKALNLDCHVVPDPTFCVARGIWKIFRDERLMSAIFKKQRKAMYREMSDYS